MTRVVPQHKVGLKSIKLMCVCRAAHNDDTSPAQCPHSAVHIERHGRQARDPARAVMFGLAVPIVVAGAGGYGGYGSSCLTADTDHHDLWRIRIIMPYGGYGSSCLTADTDHHALWRIWIIMPYGGYGSSCLTADTDHCGFWRIRITVDFGGYGSLWIVADTPQYEAWRWGSWGQGLVAAGGMAHERLGCLGHPGFTGPQRPPRVLIPCY